LPIQNSISNAIKGDAPLGGVTPPFNQYSFEFDGSTDYVDIGNPTNLNTITNISISAWFKTTSTVNGVIVGSDDAVQGRRYILRIESSSGMKLRFFSFSSNSSFTDIIGTTNINDGNWHHVMAINDGTNLKLYVDGALDNSNTNGHAINTTFATRMGDAATWTGKTWDLTDQGSGGNDGFSDTIPGPPAQPSTDIPT
jgi:hypothetical protein